MQLLFCFLAIPLAVATRVAVTGAAGRTGSLVFSKLLQDSTVSPIAIVRSSASINKLLKLGATKEQIITCDVTNVDELADALKGVEKVIMCTSAVPKIKLLSIVKSLIGKVFGKSLRPEFTFPTSGDPYNVDWLGAKNQIDASKAARVKQFVFLSSMGGTQPDNFLNTIGKVESDPNSGNILLWKRKAEEYLTKSGLGYTIIHPGGLLDKKGGEREIVFGIDDQLLKEKVRSIPRTDVAEVCVQAIKESKAVNRAFDIISKEPGQGVVTTNWNQFFSQKGNCKY
jgi:uncharacterized protein YbjT (DUF2867 family)